MKHIQWIVALGLLFFFCATRALADTPPNKDGWIPLFDGKTLDGWKAAENPDSFCVEDGAIVAHRQRAHLFYMGPVENHDFRDFELRADVKTTPGSNSGIFFHTKYQPTSPLQQGYEVQVNQTHTDPRRTGGLFDVKDVATSPAKDDVWFRLHVTVRSTRVVVRVDGKTVVDYTEPDDYKPPKSRPGRKIGHGTFALQAHDPKSKVYFKNIEVKPLGD
ncbi:MAG: DUF1080 domain-containing protein [Pirellulales bacterium]|nr:DUF1080 domain-containing protein [Pirellulales bacterium]